MAAAPKYSKRFSGLLLYGYSGYYMVYWAGKYSPYYRCLSNLAAYHQG